MATAEYSRWDSRGRPYSVALPIRQLVDLASGHGVPILGVIGNEAHLTADFPEDHTPFSYTAWPNALPGYIVTACDLADGPWSDRILALAKSGALPMVKYLNFRGKNYSVKRNWEPISNSDRHLHISVRTDHLNTPLGVNPFATQGESMTDPSEFYDPSSDLDDAQQHNTERYLQAIVALAPTVRDLSAVSAARYTAPNELAAALGRIESTVKTPAAITLTGDQLAYLSQTIAGEVVKGLLAALRGLVGGTSG